MDFSLETVPKKPRIKEIERETAALIRKNGTLPTLTFALLFCLLVTLTVYCLLQFVIYLTGLFSTTLTAITITEIVLAVLEVFLFLTCVMPLWLGKLRMAGLLWQGEKPPLSDIFYYFTSSARYARIWRVGAVMTLLYLVPAFAIFGLFYGSFYLYSQVFCLYLSGPLAVLLFLFSLIVALAASLAIFFFSGIYAMFAAVAVGNENMRVRHAFFLAVKSGKGNLVRIFVFSLKSLLWLILSFFTIGVLHVLWFSHHYNLSYLRLSMALCPKEEAT